MTEDTTKYLLYHAIGGIFLGKYGNSFVWSDLDPGGVCSAFVFDTISSMLAFIQSELSMHDLENFSYYSIQVPTNSNFVSLFDILNSDNRIPVWNPQYSPARQLQ